MVRLKLTHHKDCGDPNPSFEYVVGHVQLMQGNCFYPWRMIVRCACDRLPVVEWKQYIMSKCHVSYMDHWVPLLVQPGVCCDATFLLR